MVSIKVLLSDALLFIWKHDVITQLVFTLPLIGRVESILTVISG